MPFYLRTLEGWVSIENQWRWHTICLLGLTEVSTEQGKEERCYWRIDGRRQSNSVAFSQSSDALHGQSAFADRIWMYT